MGNNLFNRDKQNECCFDITTTASKKRLQLKQGVAALKPSGLSTADDEPGDENSLAYSGRKLGTEKSKSLFTVSGMSTPGSEVG